MATSRIGFKGMTIAPYAHPDYEKNAAVALRNGETPCVFCGRGSRRSPWKVRVRSGLEKDATPRFEMQVENFSFTAWTFGVVGEICARRLAREGVWVRKGE